MPLQPIQPQRFQKLPSTGTWYQARLKPAVGIQAAPVDAPQKLKECEIEPVDLAQGQIFHKLPSTGTWCQKRVVPLQAAAHDKENRPTPANGAPVLAKPACVERSQHFTKLPSTGTWIQKLPPVVPLEAASLDKENRSNVANDCFDQVLSKPADFNKLPSTGTWCQQLRKPAAVANTGSMAAPAPESVFIGIVSPKEESDKENSRYLADNTLEQTLAKQADVPSAKKFGTMPSTGTWCQKLLKPVDVVDTAPQTEESDLEKKAQCAEDSSNQTEEKPAEDQKLSIVAETTPVVEKEGVADEAPEKTNKEETPKAEGEDGNCQIQ